jgi:hypothetical protein
LWLTADATRLREQPRHQIRKAKLSRMGIDVRSIELGSANLDHSDGVAPLTLGTASLAPPY